MLQVRDVARTVVERWSFGWRNALASAVAAGLSWLLAHTLLGDPQPLFATIAAVVCLAPGLPSHGRQAVQMMLGVATGILVGEVLVLIPIFDMAVRIAIITFVAMMAALAFGTTAVITIQAGVSAILVLGIGPITAGPARLMDVALGAAVGLFFSQILLTPDPVRLVDGAARRMLHELAHGFAADAEALAHRDPQKAQAALRHFFAAHESVTALGAGIASARSMTRWSLRGRLAARDVAEMTARYDRRAIRLYASTLLFGEALANALRRGEEPAAGLNDRVAEVAKICAMLAGGAATLPELTLTPMAQQSAVPGWQPCLGHLRSVENALGALQQTSAPHPKAAESSLSSSGRSQS